MANDTMPARAKRRKYLFPSREEAETAFTREERQGSLYRKALLCALHESPVWTGRKGDYRGALYRVHGGDGGIILWTFSPRGQSPHTEARVFDELVDTMNRHARHGIPEAVELSILLGEAGRARRQAWDAENAAREGGAA